MPKDFEILPKGTTDQLEQLRSENEQLRTEVDALQLLEHRRSIRDYETGSDGGWHAAIHALVLIEAEPDCDSLICVRFRDDHAHATAERKRETLVEESQRGAEAARRPRRDEVDRWSAATKSDAEIGGAAFNENLSLAIGVVARYGTPGLRDVLETHGLGSHPEVIRILARVGRALDATQKPDPN